MLTGDPPFVADDPMELYQQILRGSFSFPSFVAKQARDLVQKLLMATPAMRLGIVKRGHRDLVTHSWLKPIDLKALDQRTGKPPPPHVPRIAHDADMSNYDMEEGADRSPDPAWERPVSAAEQKLFDQFSV